MEATHWRLYRYALPLTEPLNLATGTVGERVGMLVSVEDDKGRVGWGEIAPLPGFSKATLEEARAAATRAIAARDVVPLSDDALDPTRPFPGCRFDPSIPASVCFGVDMAAADLIAQRQGTHIAYLLSQGYQRQLPVNALLMGAADAVERGAVAVRKHGYSAVKLKVGRQPVKEDIRLVRAVHERLRPDVRLRLDANRAWTLAQARTFVEGVNPRSIEYMEEPLADVGALNGFAAEVGCAVALDETVQETNPEALEAYYAASAIILKPTLVGGVDVQRRWAEAARQQGMATVYSAAFESGVGMRHLIALAAAFGTPGVPVGFDTYRWLAEDLIDPRLELGRPHLDVDAILTPPQHLRMEYLERV